MSRYAHNDFRRPRELGERRSRSPPRPMPDYRRPSAAGVFNDRTPDTLRSGSDAPRGPRSQFDSRPLPGNNPPPGSATRSAFPPRAEVRELRDAAPLSNDRGRPYRERDSLDRRERPPSPRERSPALSRYGRDVRDLPPRDGDIGRARRGSRDGPVPVTPTYLDGPLPGSAQHRGGFGRGRGRGRGDFGFRGGRGDRMALDDRDLFRRERSPGRWPREPPRDPPRDPPREPPREVREQDRRDDRRFERGEDDRRGSEWSDRERESDRPRREQPPPRPEQRQQSDAQAGNPPGTASSTVAHVNPDRLAMLESAGVDFGSQRRPSVQSSAGGREARREQPAMPSHLNGRAEVFNNRYGPRNSPPPTQAAPAVPEFRLSFAQPSTQGPGPGPASNVWKAPQDRPASLSGQSSNEPSKVSRENTADKTAETAASRAPPPAPKAHRAGAPLAAPKAPRALEPEQPQNAAGGRLQGARPWESMNPPRSAGNNTSDGRQPDLRTSLPGSAAQSPAFGRPTLPNLNSPLSPNTQQPQHLQQSQRFSDFTAPTGPRAARPSPANPAASPRPPDGPSPQVQPNQGVSRAHTPPPSAPSGPRNSSWSVSPKTASLHVPTAPKGSRVPPLAPRGQDRPGPGPISRPPDRNGAPPGFAPPPTAPRATSQFHSWRGQRQPPPFPPDRVVPAKRDYAGMEKEKHIANGPSTSVTPQPLASPAVKAETTTDASKAVSSVLSTSTTGRESGEASHTRSLSQQGHSAQQSFFGKPIGEEDEDEDESMMDAPEDAISSSDEELDVEDLTLFEAKYERQKRELEAQMVELDSSMLRATTPLEAVARVARISALDWERSHEHLDSKMDLGEQKSDEGRLMPPAPQSSGSDDGPDLLTPKGEDHATVDVVMEEDVAPARAITRRPQPEVVRLPFLLKRGSPTEDEQLFVAEPEAEDMEDDIFNALQEAYETQDRLQNDAENAFEQAMHLWRQQCDELDALREEQGRLDRDQTPEALPEPEPQMGPPVNPQPGGRRGLMKFASEYDLAKVMKESEETARMEREKQELDARKNQADMDKEAIVPNQWTEADMKVNVKTEENRRRDPDKLTSVFAFKPPVDDFTLQEQATFVAAYKETPKKWGEIASLLPGRTYKDCIHHYYATKWDGRFRDKTKKYRARGGRARGKGQIVRGGKGSAAMADLQGRIPEEVAPAVSDSGRPKRAAAPTTFGEREADAKAALAGPSPAKKPGAAPKSEATGEANGEKQPKRARKVGDKGARKGKGAQPLANLAAAPMASPDRHFIPGLQAKDESQSARDLEHARLLAGLSAGQQGMFVPEVQQIVFQEATPQQAAPPEEPERVKPQGPSAPSRPSASSYWSVPEQSDFVKYIGHFGTDFAAIAAHMGTKTQTMIKNHFQRQVEGGTRAALQEAAETANAKRARGENMGAPPTPTPIVKRKYDNPTQNAPRTLAPQADVMDMDESAPQSRRQQPSQPAQASPPNQIQGQSRFTASAQSTPVPPQRVAPSPAPTSAATVTSRTPLNTMSRGVSRSSILADSRPEARPALTSSAPSFTRGSPQAHNVVQQQQPPRSTPDGTDPGFINSLREEQEKAMRIQNGQLNMEQGQQRQFQRPSVYPPGSLQQPPTSQPPPTQPERRQMTEERARSPPRHSVSGLPTGPMSQQRAPYEPPGGMRPVGASPWSGQGSRLAFNQSPTKKEEPRLSEPRPSSVPAVPPMQPPRPSAPPEPPKRSNLSALLNDEPEQPKQQQPPPQQPPPQQPKRISSDQGVPPFAPSQRTQSPANAHIGQSPMPTPGAMHNRQEMMFGRSAASQSSFARPALGNFSQSIASQNPAVKQEPPSHGSPLPQSHPQQQPPNRDWAASALSQSSRDGAAKAAAAERDMRGFSQHRAGTLGKLNEPLRANPSPPPYGNVLSHSRTSSHTGQVGSQLGRDAREMRDPRDGRDPREIRDMRDIRDVREMRDPRDGREFRDVRDMREARDPRELREPLSALPGQMQQQQPQSGPPGSAALHSNPYARVNPPFSQAPAQQPSHAHHAHATSMGGFPAMQPHSRQPSREEVMRHDIARQQQDLTYAAQRKREEEFDAYRRDREIEQRNWDVYNANQRHPLERQYEQERVNERQRQEQQMQQQQHQQQQQQHQAQAQAQANAQAAQHQQQQHHQQQQQQQFARAPQIPGSQPPQQAMQPVPAHYGGRPFESLRERARREAEEAAAAQHERYAEEERRYRDPERLRHESGMGMFRPADGQNREMGRRQMEEEAMARRTPLGRGYGGPPPPPPGQGGGMR